MDVPELLLWWERAEGRNPLVAHLTGPTRRSPVPEEVLNRSVVGDVAQVIAQAVADTPGLRLDPPEVETNLIWIEVDPDLGTARDVALRLKERGILVHTSGPHTFRACTHLDVSAAQALKAAEAIREAVPRVTAVR